MDWQDISVAVILGLALVYLIKKYTKKDKNCNNGNCCDR